MTDRLRKFIPVLDWGRTYNGAALSNDLVAAVIVTIMLIPQSLAYALLAGLPPLWGFPLLPQPLRFTFGLRARTLDRLLEQVVAERGDCRYLPTQFEPAPEKFSADGYHPSTESYRVWGGQLADAVLEVGPVP